MIQSLGSTKYVLSDSKHSITWAREFARVASCTRCTGRQFSCLLRDDAENVPQPGYTGLRYWTKRVLLVGQNPAVPPERLAAADRPYTAALRKLRDEAIPENYAHLHSILTSFIPSWPVHESYFPLRECGLELDEIAYCNLVRCRTVENRTPAEHVSMTCTEEHFDRWVELLQPCVVVFIGKWAHDRGFRRVQSRGIPFAFMNRQRSLPSQDRQQNRSMVVALVRKATAESGVNLCSAGDAPTLE